MEDATDSEFKDNNRESKAARIRFFHRNSRMVVFVTSSLSHLRCLSPIGAFIGGVLVEDKEGEVITQVEKTLMELEDTAGWQGR